ncbi:hypothetical protein ANN_25600 [Periplaneta americana]|uniref:ACB domain-containing protein n=1 Tax=Periplaneta americana TaxID=6978 RepID=A0ABQ8S1E7_PERAM|nr:hypothetical protein ANN_25600 [Periplaneta americana]
MEKYIRIMQQLCEDFERRYQEIRELEQQFKIFATSFSVSVLDIPAEPQLEILDLQSDIELKDKYQNRKTVSTASWCDVSANSREKAESHALAGLKVIEISPATSKINLPTELLFRVGLRRLIYTTYVIMMMMMMMMTMMDIYWDASEESEFPEKIVHYPGPRACPHNSSELLIKKIRREGVCAGDEKLESPGKNRRRELLIIVDDMNRCILRRKIQEFYTVQKEVPTLKKLLKVAREAIISKVGEKRYGNSHRCRSWVLAEGQVAEMRPLALFLFAESLRVELLWVGVVLGVVVYGHHGKEDRVPFSTVASVPRSFATR